MTSQYLQEIQNAFNKIAQRYVSHTCDENHTIYESTNDHILVTLDSAKERGTFPGYAPITNGIAQALHDQGFHPTVTDQMISISDNKEINKPKLCVSIPDELDSVTKLRAIYRNFVVADAEEEIDRCLVNIDNLIYARSSGLDSTERTKLKNTMLSGIKLLLSDTSKAFIPDMSAIPEQFHTTYDECIAWAKQSATTMHETLKELAPYERGPAISEIIKNSHLASLEAEKTQLS